jgi:hypothetical protein
MTCAHDVTVRGDDGRDLADDAIAHELGQSLTQALGKLAMAELVGRAVSVRRSARCGLCAADCVVEWTFTVGADDPVATTVGIVQ